jgi:hypothetical protein
LTNQDPKTLLLELFGEGTTVIVSGESLEDEQIVGNRSKGVVFEVSEGRDKIFIINFAQFVYLCGPRKALGDLEVFAKLIELRIDVGKGLELGWNRIGVHIKPVERL